MLTEAIHKIDAIGIGKDFPTKSGILHVLADIDLLVKEGESLVLLGPSGSGKSTLLRILAGLDQPTTGELKMDGKRVTGPGRERGMVFQSYTSFPWLTVLENVEFALEQAPLTSIQRTNIAKYYIRMVGLEQFQHYYPGKLSGGMQQRVAIARALAAQPEVMLFDEPFGALDALTRTRMQEELINILVEAEESTMVFVTHDVEEAIFLADRILILSCGKPARICTEIKLTGERSISISSDSTVTFDTVIPALKFGRNPDFKRENAFYELRKGIEGLLREDPQPYIMS